MNAQIAPTFAPQSPPPSLPIVSTPIVPESSMLQQATKAEINALHNQFQTYGQNAKHWLRQCQILLPRIRDEEVWSKKGFTSIYEYAAKLAGMSHNSVNEALRVYDALQDKPILRDEIQKHGTHKIKTIVTVVTENTQKFWLKKLNEISKSTLETYVREYKKDLQNGLPGEGQRIPNQDENMSNTRRAEGLRCEIKREATNGEAKTASIYMKLEVEVIEKLKRIKGDRDWNELMKDLLDEKVETTHGFSGKGAATEESEGQSKPDNAARRCEIHEKPAPVNTGKRYVPIKIKRHVIQQTSGLCAYPGCSKPYEILHHTKRFALDATHDPDTLHPMCKAHERLAHKGLIENEEMASVDWSLRTEANESEPKYGIDKKVNEYYMPCK